MISSRFLVSCLCLPLLAITACQTKAVDDKENNNEETPGNDTTDAGAEQPTTIAALGGGTHSLDSVDLEVIGSKADGLSVPRDLDFNPGAPGELWVVNRKDDSVVRYTNVGTAEQKSEHRIDSYAMHFMEEVSAISFAEGVTYENGNIFGTCQESNNTYNDQAMGNGFMGPALWTSDWDIFGFSNPEAVESLGGTDLGSHIDMMHESPYCMGIGWETDNVYWTVDGGKKTISRYDFAEHHFPGYDDHSDGTVLRYNDVQYTRVEDVPSHILFSKAEKVVFYNDTGSGRVMRFDPATAVKGRDRSNSSKDHGMFHDMDGGELTVVADSSNAEGMQNPSGLALKDDVLYVTDNASSIIYAIKTDGTVLDWLETGRPAGSLMGIRVDAEGSVWFVDAKANELVRVRAKAAE